VFEALTQRLEAIFDRLRGAGRLTEENIQEALREVRVALLEGDVNFKVARAFVERVRERAVGQEVLQSVTPGQQVVKVVHEELVALIGGATHRLTMAPRPPTVIMVLGEAAPSGAPSGRPGAYPRWRPSGRRRSNEPAEQLGGPARP